MNIKIFKQEIQIYAYFGLAFFVFCVFGVGIKLISLIEVKLLMFCLFCLIERFFLLKMLYVCEVIKLERIKKDTCKEKNILYYNYFFAEDFNKWCVEITDKSKVYKSVISRVLVGESFLENLTEMQHIFSLLELKSYKIIIKTVKNDIIKEMVLDDFDKLIEIYRELLLSQKLWNILFEIYNENEKLVKRIEFSKKSKMMIYMKLSDKENFIENFQRE